MSSSLFSSCRLREFCRGGEARPSASSRPMAGPSLWGGQPRAVARPSTSGAVSVKAMHPDAVKREEERLKRKEEQAQLLEKEKTGTWWQCDYPNVEYMDDPATVELMLASQSISRTPCVVHFFAQDCPGCKAMHPKLNQIIRNNSDFKFIKVNATSPIMKYNIARWNVKSLPYFFVFNRGQLQREFSCNLSTVHKLRSALVYARTEPQAQDDGSSAESSKGAVPLTA